MAIGPHAQSLGGGNPEWAAIWPGDVNRVRIAEHMWIHSPTGIPEYGMLCAWPNMGSGVDPDRHFQDGPAVPTEQATSALGMQDDCVPGGDDGGGDLGEDGIPGPGRFKVWVVTPVAVETIAAVMLSLPGHQATNTPFPLVAVTSVPFPNESVTPVTPFPVRPTTSVYESPSRAPELIRSTTIAPGPTGTPDKAIQRTDVLSEVEMHRTSL